METVIVSNSQFYSHYPRQIPKGSVKAEQVEIRLDKSWDGLTVRIHWLNVASGVEKVVLLERDQPNTIPWEVLTDLGELRMGLVGLDGEMVIKPTIWLTYGYVVDGVDPESGSDPQPPTPSWEQQMVEQATQANQAAQAAQKAAEEAAESVASAGPYAEEAKEAAEAAKASEEAAATSAQQANEAARTAQEAAGSIGDAVEQAQSAATAAGAAQQAAEAAQGAASNSAGIAQTSTGTATQAAQEANSAATKAGQYLTSVESAAQAAAAAATAAGRSQEAAQGAAQTAANARDQATTAATTAQSHATAASTAKTAAEQAATTAGTAQAGAARSAQSAASSAQAAERAKQEAQNAAAAFPAPSPEAAGMVPIVNPEGDGYIFGEAGSGGEGWELLLAEYIHRGNQEIYPSSIDWGTGIIECTEPHGLSDAVKVMVVPADYPASLPDDSAKYIPQEIALYQSSLYAVPVDENRLKLTGDDKSTPISVDTGYSSNSNIDMTKLRLEVPIGWSISNIPTGSPSLRVQITGFAMPVTPQYLQITSPEIGARYFYFAQTPNFGINNPKQLVIFHTEITISVTRSGIYASSGLSIFRGRRKDNDTGLHDQGNIRRDSATGIPGGKQNVSITGLQSPSSFAYCSNGTEVLVYTLGRRAK